MRFRLTFDAKYAPLFGLAFILVVYGVVTLTTSWCAPLGVGPDEVAHFMLTRFIAQTGHLPLTLDERNAAGYKSDQPPLNALLVAAFFQGDLNAPPYIKLTHDIPRRNLASGPNSMADWRALNTEDPLAGEVLLWRVGRWWSVWCSGLTLVVIYGLALLVFEDYPRRTLRALAAVACVAFIPTFVFISGVLSYENLLGLWLSLYLLIVVYLLKKGDAAAWWLYLAAGLLIGLAIVTKLSALLAPLSLVGVVGVAGYRAGWSKSKLLWRGLVASLGVALGGGWWFGLVALKLNRINDLGPVMGLLQPFVVADGSDVTSVQIAHSLSGGQLGFFINTGQSSSLADWGERLFRTFWRWQWPGQETIFTIMAVITVLIVLGLARVWYKEPKSRLWLALLSGQVILFFILPFTRWLVTRQTILGQGQHILFPAVGAFAVLMAWGLGAWLPRRWQWAGGLALGMGLLGWSSWQAIQIYQPPLPVQTVPPGLPASATATSLDFGQIALIGYEVQPFNVTSATSPAALAVKLYWQAKELTADDYLTEVTLVNAAGQNQTGWLGHPANGRYPTRAWEPGDFVRDEVWLPLVGLPAGEYDLKLRLVEHPPAEAVTLTHLNLPASGGKDVSVFQLWQQGQVTPPSSVFQSRETIQITTGDEVNLSLVDPAGQVRPPTAVFGRTHIFIVDLRWPRGQYGARLEPKAGEATWDSPSILFAWGEGRPTKPPPSQVAVKANFANQLLLLGYNAPVRRLAAGEALPITLNLQALHTMPADFIMFTRLLDEKGQVWGGYDRKPRELYSTLLWAPGEVVEDGFSIQVAPNAPEGMYYLNVGFYLQVGVSSVSLPLVQNGQMSAVTSVTIGPIEVTHQPGLTGQ